MAPPITTGDQLIEVTLSLSTDAYTSGDVLAATQVVTNAVREHGCAILQSLAILDTDDQGLAMDIVFLRSDTAIGTENAALNIADAAADEILTVVEVAAGDWVDLVNSQIAIKKNGDSGMGAVLKPTTGDHLYIAAIARGAPTHTAAGIIIKIGLLRS